MNLSRFRQRPLVWVWITCCWSFGISSCGNDELKITTDGGSSDEKENGDNGDSQNGADGDGDIDDDTDKGTDSEQDIVSDSEGVAVTDTSSTADTGNPCTATGGTCRGLVVSPTFGCVQGEIPDPGTSCEAGDTIICCMPTDADTDTTTTDTGTDSDTTVTDTDTDTATDTDTDTASPDRNCDSEGGTCRRPGLSSSLGCESGEGVDPSLSCPGRLELCCVPVRGTCDSAGGTCREPAPNPLEILATCKEGEEPNLSYECAESGVCCVPGGGCEALGGTCRPLAGSNFGCEPGEAWDLEISVASCNAGLTVELAPTIPDIQVCCFPE